MLSCDKCKEGVPNLINTRCGACSRLFHLCEGCNTGFVACSEQCLKAWRATGQEWMNDYLTPTRPWRGRKVDQEGQKGLF